MNYTHNGQSYHFTDEGAGETLVFLHGLGGNLLNWTYQRQHFARTHRVICIDLPGHGKSQGKDVPFADFSDVVNAILGYVGVDRYTVCGLAKGARVALRLAATTPSRVQRLVVVNTCLRLCPGERAKRLELYDELLMGPSGVHSWATQLLGLMSIPDESRIHRGFMRALESTDPVWLRERFLEILDLDQDEDASLVRCPTLLIRGGKDHLVRARCHEELHALIPEARTLSLPECGHLPYLEAPETFNAALDDFLSR